VQPSLAAYKRHAAGCKSENEARRLVSSWPSKRSSHSESAAQVTDAYLPYEVVFDGFVVLDVSLDKRGEVIGTEAIRDPGSMVPAAITSVQTWKVRPGTLGNSAIPSEMTAAFVYRPRPNGPAAALPPRDFKPVLPHPHTEGIDFVPAGIVSFAYPDYPANSVAWGSVIVQVTVNSEGRMENTEVLRGMAPFTDFAVDALRNWHFQAATLNSKPVSSQLPIAFIFQTPVSSP
jgi:TonB family protein